MKLVTEQKASFKRVEIYPFDNKELFEPYIQIDFVTLNKDGVFVSHDTGIVTINANIKHLGLEDAASIATAIQYALSIANGCVPDNDWMRSELEAFFATLEPARTEKEAA